MDEPSKTPDDIQGDFYTRTAGTTAILDALYCLDQEQAHEFTLKALCDTGAREIKAASDAFNDVLSLYLEERRAHAELKKNLEAQS